MLLAAGAGGRFGAADAPADLDNRDARGAAGVRGPATTVDQDGAA